jgi:hypothetical protein
MNCTALTFELVKPAASRRAHAGDNQSRLQWTRRSTNAVEQMRSCPTSQLTMRTSGEHFQAMSKVLRQPLADTYGELRQSTSGMTDRVSARQVTRRVSDV